MSTELRVIKVGGSLYDLPDLGARLRKTFAQWPKSHLLIVPGGGPAVDVVRSWQTDHDLSDEQAHQLALEMLSVCASFLSDLIQIESNIVKNGSEIAVRGKSPGISILDANAYLCSVEQRQGELFPHDWTSTSDSIALIVALRCRATELMLLKSVDTPKPEEVLSRDELDQLVDAGILDATFGKLLQHAGKFPGMPIRILNLRTKGETFSRLPDQVDH